MKIPGLTCEWNLSAESRKNRGQIATKTNQQRDWDRCRDRPPLDDDRILSVRKLWEAGKSYQEINRELNVQIPYLKLICQTHASQRYLPRNEREYKYVGIEAVRKAIASPPRRWRRKPVTDRIPG